ncbi:hypothetical protein D3C76_1391870 [compost metagenome]
MSSNLYRVQGIFNLLVELYVTARNGNTLHLKVMQCCQDRNRIVSCCICIDDDSSHDAALLLPFDIHLEQNTTLHLITLRTEQS